MDIGLISMRMAADTGGLQTDFKKAGDVVKQATSDMAASTKTATTATVDYTLSARQAREAALAQAAAQSELMDKLQSMAATAGMTRLELMKMQAATLGLSDAAKPYIDSIEKATAKTHELTLANAGVTRELGVLGREAANGNWSRFEGSLTVLASRTGLLEKAISSITSPLGIATAAFIAMGAAVAYVIVKHEEHEIALAHMEQQLAATGRASSLTKDELTKLIDTIAQAPQVTRDMAEKTVDAFTRVAGVSGEMTLALAKLVPDFASGIGEQMPAAAKKLADAFADPVSGVKSLDKELHLFNTTQLLAIEQALRLDDVDGARVMMLAALQARLEGVRDKGTEVQQATHEMYLAWEKLMDSTKDSAGLKFVDSALVKLIDGITWIIEHGDSLTRALSVIPGVGVLGHAANMMIPAANANGGATGSWGSAADDSKNAEIDTEKAALKVAAAYKDAGEKVSVYKEKQEGLNAQLAISIRLHGEDSTQVRELEAGIQGLQDKIDKLNAQKNKGAAATMRDDINSQIEELKRGNLLMLEEYKQQEAHVKSLYGQGLIDYEDMVLQETQLKLAASAATEDELKAAIEAAKGKKNSLTEVAKLEGQLALEHVKQQGIVLAADDEVEAHRAKSWDQSYQAYVQGLNAQQKDIDSTETQILKIKDEIDAHDKSTEAIQKVTLAREMLRAERLRALDLYGPDLDLLDQEIAKHKELIAVMDTKKIQDANDKAAASAEKAWAQSAKSIEEGLYNAVTNGAGSGFKKLLSDVKNWFAHLILSPIIQPIGQFGASLLNPTAASAGGGSGSMLNNASSAYNMYGAATGYSSGVNTLAGFAGAGSTAGASALSLGYGNAVGAAGGDALGATIAANGSWAGVSAGSTGITAAAMDVATSNAALGVSAGLSAGEATAAAAAAAEAGAATTVAAGATTAAAGTMTAALASIPVVGWIALAAYAIYSLSSSPGGPKTEGGYSAPGLSLNGTDTGAAFATNPQRGDVASAKQYTDSISATYAAMAGTLQLSQKAIDVGLFYAKDPQGTSQTQLQVTSSAGYNRANLLGGIENVGRTDAEFQTAVTDATSQLLLQALKTSDLAQKYKDILNQVADTAGTADITTAINHVTAARTQELSLTEQLYQLTATDAEKLARTRDAERAAVDPLNAALLEQVYAQQDLLAATAAATAAMAVRQSWQDKLDVLTGKTTAVEQSLQHDLASTTDAATQAIIRQVYAQQAIATATAAATAATDAAMTALQNSVTAARQVAAQQVTDLSALSTLLGNSISQLYGQGSTAAMTGAAGSQFITQALSAAKSTGYLPNATDLQGAITAASGGITNGNYKSQQEQDFARLVLAGQLSQLKDLTDPQLTLAQQQVAYLDSLVADAQKQIDALRGINSSVLSVADAIAAFQVALTGEKNTKPVTTGSTSAATGGSVVGVGSGTGAGLGHTIVWSEFQDYFNTYGSGASGPARMAQYLQYYGETEASAAKALSLDPAQVKQYFDNGGIPSFAVGTNYLPRDMLIQAHEGEAVVPKAYNPAAGGSAPSSDSAQSARIDQLISVCTQIVINTRATADVFQRAQRVSGGSAIAVTTVAAGT